MNDLIPLPDFHHYFILFLSVFVLSVILYFSIKFFPRKRVKKRSKKSKTPCEILKKLNFQKKEDLFVFSLEIQEMIGKNEDFNLLNKKIQEYKYSNKEEKIPTSLEKEMKNFIQNICNFTHKS